jgi:FkbM family methyltransferase
MKKVLISIACFINRNIRYGNSKNRLVQYVVIRTRFYLKKFIQQHNEFVNHLGIQKIKLAHAGKMELQTNDYIDHWLFTGADFEPHVVSLFLKTLKKGDNVLDIGANIGYFSLIASRIVGEKGRVYAFEPTPATIQKLQKNIQLNKLSNIRVYQKAVSETNSTAVFKIPSDVVKNSGRASFRDIEENYTMAEVETIQLDSILNELQPIQLIKMDIEGAEAMALNGMAQLIERDQPLFIMELSDYYLKQLGSSAALVVDFFKEKKYKVFTAGEDLREVNEDTILTAYQYDILCIPTLKMKDYNLG